MRSFTIPLFVFLAVISMGCATQYSNPEDFRQGAKGYISFNVPENHENTYKKIVDFSRSCWDRGPFRVRGDVYANGTANITMGMFTGYVSGILLQTDINKSQQGSSVKIYYITEAWEPKARLLQSVAVDGNGICP